jgi:hypothetical protein
MKWWKSPSSPNPNTSQGDYGKPPDKAHQKSQTTMLDHARSVSLLVSNIGSGAFGIPGLQMVGLIAIQVIDVIKVRRKVWLLDPRSTDYICISSENTSKQGRVRAVGNAYQGAHGGYP